MSMALAAVATAFFYGGWCLLEASIHGYCLESLRICHFLRPIYLGLMLASFCLPFFVAGVVESRISSSTGTPKVAWVTIRAFWSWWLAAGLLAVWDFYMLVVNPDDPKTYPFLIFAMVNFSVTLPATLVRLLRQHVCHTFGRTVITIGALQVEEIQAYGTTFGAAIIVSAMFCAAMPSIFPCCDEALEDGFAEFALMFEIMLLPCAVALAASIWASCRTNRGTAGHSSSVLTSAWAFLGGLAVSALPSITTLYLMMHRERMPSDIFQEGWPMPVAVMVNATMLALAIWASYRMRTRLLRAVTIGTIVGSFGWACFLNWLYTPRFVGEGKPHFLKDYLSIHAPVVSVTILPFVGMALRARRQPPSGTPQLQELQRLG